MRSLGQHHPAVTFHYADRLGLYPKMMHEALQLQHAVWKTNGPSHELGFSSESKAIIALHKNTKEVAGMCIFDTYEETGEAIITCLGVHGLYQKLRIGQCLVHNCLQEISKEYFGVKLVTVGTSAKNESARRLYRKYAFDETETVLYSMAPGSLPRESVNETGKLQERALFG